MLFLLAYLPRHSHLILSNLTLELNRRCLFYCLFASFLAMSKKRLKEKIQEGADRNTKCSIARGHCPLLLLLLPPPLLSETKAMEVVRAYHTLQGKIVFQAMKIHVLIYPPLDGLSFLFLVSLPIIGG